MSAPALTVSVDDEDLVVVRLTLAYDSRTPVVLDEGALERITEAAAVAAHQAYERELDVRQGGGGGDRGRC